MSEEKADADDRAGAEAEAPRTDDAASRGVEATTDSESGVRAAAGDEGGTNMEPGASRAEDVRVGAEAVATGADPWTREELCRPAMQAAFEALLFAADRPLGVPDFVQVLEELRERPAPPQEVRSALERLTETLNGRGGGVEVAAVAGGWQLRTRAECADWIHTLYRRKPVRLSRAALEVLAIVAYRQPCTRADVDEIRGVDSSSTLRQLLERSLLRILGKADDVGRPLIYGTSEDFLHFFGLNSLSELPTLRDFTELSEEHLVALEKWEASLEEASASVSDRSLAQRELALESLEENKGGEKDAGHQGDARSEDEDKP